MIIESLIRLGRPMVSGGLSPEQVLRQVSDVNNPLARNFLTKVILVEIDKLSGQVGARYYQMGTYETSKGKSSKQVFYPNLSKALGIPFVLPSGGNPLLPQGRYGIPSYPIYEKHFAHFQKGKEGVNSFLQGRMDKTVFIGLTELELEQVVSCLANFFKQFNLRDKEKKLGLLSLLEVAEEGLYRYENEGYLTAEGQEIILNESQLQPGKVIVADLAKIEKAFWESKLIEGEEKGVLEGTDAHCAFCGNTGRAVSSYSKAWNWFTTTWPAPFSVFLKESELVEGIALCPECYQGLTLGSSVFESLTATLPQWLTREIFSPVDSPSGRENKRTEDIPVYGGVMALPIIDHWLENEEEKAEFINSLLAMIEEKAISDKKKADLHLSTISGMEMNLPASLTSNDFRLTMLYYSGDPSRGDIHLRATIEDVVPPTVQMITDLVIDTYEDRGDLKQHLFKEPDLEFRNRRYTSLPALLSRAYGTTYLWTTLSRILHREPIQKKPFIRNVALRLRELGHHFPDKFYAIYEEVFFYLHFKDLLEQYDKLIGINSKGGDVKVRTWQELLKLLKEKRFEELTPLDVEELGLAVGYLIRLFANVYYKKTKHDYLKDRVITFGSNLAPESIWKYGLIKMELHAARHKIDMGYLERLLGIVLLEYSRLRTEINAQSDEFLAAFWAGYALNRKEKNEESEIDQSKEENKDEQQLS